MTVSPDIFAGIGGALTGTTSQNAALLVLTREFIIPAAIKASAVPADQRTSSERKLAGILDKAKKLAGRDDAEGEGLTADLHDLLTELEGALDFSTPQSLSLENLLGTLAQLLLQPTRVPGEPCLAPAPLLRDLLDLALGRLEGGLGAIFGKVGATVEDLLLPGFAAAEDLADFVQAVLDDPITAALNLVLGQRNQIDCVVEGGLGVAESVFQTGVRHLEEKIAAGIG